MRPADAPDATPAPVADDSLIDNGLWEGASVGPCCAICGGGSGCPPDWYVEEGARIMGRTRARKGVLGFFEVPPTQTTPEQFLPVLTTRSASPDISLAYATTIGHYFARDVFNRDNFVEFSYWGLNEWKDSAQVNGLRLRSDNGDGTSTVTGNLFSGFFNPTTNTILRGFDNADQQSTFYSSFENNFEINGRISPRSRNDRLVLQPNGRWERECQPGMYMSYLYGLRFMQIDETFRFHSVGTTQLVDNATGNVLSSETDTGDYDIAAHNNLLGLQVGVDMTFRECRWSWGIHSKIAPCVNFADQNSEIISPDLNAHLVAARHEAALIGEVGFMATYKFRPNLMGRASYDFMWITGIALRPSSFNSPRIPSTRSTPAARYSSTALRSAWTGCGRRRWSAQSTVAPPPRA